LAVRRFDEAAVAPPWPQAAGGAREAGCRRRRGGSEGAGRGGDVVASGKEREDKDDASVARSG
jgi:hypothetical protein